VTKSGLVTTGKFDKNTGKKRIIVGENGKISNVQRKGSLWQSGREGMPNYL
jgi:hypothetical protein